MKNLNQPSFTKLVSTCGAALILSACGSDGDSFSSGDPAVGCVQQTAVRNGVIDFTNTCEDTIIVLSSDGQRFVLEPGVTNRITGVSAGDGFAACFSPSEPEFEEPGVFICN